MTVDEMATLRDVYSVLNEESHAAKADYILQTLWRDTSSNCDIVGPYYTSTGSFKAKFLIACIMDSLQKFESFGFHITMLVMDGASTNLSMLRLLMGATGVFGHNSESDDPHKISPCFQNPFTGANVHVVICPSHQVHVYTCIIQTAYQCMFMYACF